MDLPVEFVLLETLKFPDQRAMFLQAIPRQVEARFDPLKEIQVKISGVRTRRGSQQPEIQPRTRYAQLPVRKQSS